jgi:threonine aldolase
MRPTKGKTVHIIDLRSDTVTKPTPAMRAAMASAEVGDDVYGDDPTVNHLEARAAEIFGREAAIFVPTGSMGNLIGLRLHTEHGQEVICESQAHILDWEMAMIAAFAGCIPRTVKGDHGILTWDKIKSAISPKIYYRAQTGLVWLENTHNIAGGIVTPLPILEEIWAGAKAEGLPLHLDGARVFNAAVALGIDVATLTSGFDTVMFCLSKGLGAPVGSMLVGSKENIARARIFRKALGGGMRQAGVIAAAGLIALEEMPSRLHEDHANAKLLAEAVAACENVELDASTVQTNIVIFELKNGANAAEFVASLREQGIWCSAIGPHAVRLVTHFDVSREDCEQAANAMVKLLKGMAVAA